MVEASSITTSPSLMYLTARSAILTFSSFCSVSRIKRGMRLSEKLTFRLTTPFLEVSRSFSFKSAISRRTVGSLIKSFSAELLKIRGIHLQNLIIFLKIGILKSFAMKFTHSTKPPKPLRQN